MSTRPSSVIPVQDLPILPISEQSYIVTGNTAKDKVGLVYMPEIQAASAAVGLQIGGMLSRASQDVSAMVNDANSRLNVSIADLERDFSEQLASTVSDASLVLSEFGYLVPIDFSDGINVNSSRLTISKDGKVYAANPSAIPFTTTSTFDESQWRLVQGLTALDLSQQQGSSLVGFTQIGDSPVLQSLQQKIRNLEVSANDFAGVVGDGINDDTAGLQNAFNTRRRVVLQRGMTYKVSSSISASNGIQAYFEEGASIVGPGGISLFSSASSGIVSISGRGKISGFSTLVGLMPNASIDLLQIKEITFQGTSNQNASASGSLVNYFNSDVYIKTIEVRDNTIIDGREGFLFRGTWRNALVSGNRITGVQHYAIRLGQDRSGEEWSLQGHADVFNNDIRNMYNPLTGSGSNECNAISVFSESAAIFGNYVENINGGGVDDIEGIYTKIQHGSIFGNTLKDACRREGAICIKTAAIASPADYTQANMISVYGNCVYFTLSRSHESSISIQASNVNVFGNFVMTGSGISAESSAITIKYRSPYENISIENNHVACYGSPNAYGILVWAYGKNVRVAENTIVGSAAAGVRLETRASTDVRHPGEGRHVGIDYHIENNRIVSAAVGANAGIARGISIAISPSSPLTNVNETGNKLSGAFSEYIRAISASGSSKWNIENNNYSQATGGYLWTSVPTLMRVKNNNGMITRNRGTATINESGTSVTITNPIHSALAGYLSTADISISAVSPNFYERKPSVGTIFTSGNFQINANGSGGSATIRWECSIEDRFLT